MILDVSEPRGFRGSSPPITKITGKHGSPGCCACLSWRSPGDIHSGVMRSPKASLRFEGYFVTAISYSLLAPFVYPAGNTGAHVIIRHCR